jgi:hypothetical protein
MSRGRVLRPHLAHLPALYALLLAGCIFSPEPKPPQRIVEAPAKTEAELINKLKEAYRDRDYDKFSQLFANEEGARYLFYLNDPPGEYWDLTEELRIHRRMFDPESPQPGEEPVPQERWLVSIDIQLTPQGDFAEQPIYYGPPVNDHEGLDPARWKATEGVYGTYVFFQTQGATHYQVNGRASFVVINDLTKTVGQDRKFLIFRWFDLGNEKPTAPAV